MDGDRKSLWWYMYKQQGHCLARHLGQTIDSYDFLHEGEYLN